MKRERDRGSKREKQRERDEGRKGKIEKGKKWKGTKIGR